MHKCEYKYASLAILYYIFRYSTLFESEDKTPESKDTKKTVVDSPQLTFQPIDMDLMGDLHELIFRRCSLCNDASQKRTSASDSQLIDLSVSEFCSIFKSILNSNCELFWILNNQNMPSLNFVFFMVLTKFLMQHLQHSGILMIIKRYFNNFTQKCYVSIILN